MSASRVIGADIAGLNGDELNAALEELGFSIIHRKVNTAHDLHREKEEG